MQELIKYLGDILNMSLKSKYTVQDITEELEKVRDIVAYRSYVKDHFYKLEGEYKSGYQKFIILTKDYLEIEDKAAGVKRIDDMRDEMIRAESDFIKQIMCKIYDNTSKASESVSEIVEVLGRYNFNPRKVRIIRTYDDTFVLNVVEMFKDAVYVGEIPSKEIKPYNDLPNRLKEMTKKMLK